MVAHKKRRSRNIPWQRVVKFHKEVAARAESNFFSLNGKDPMSERWTSLNGFEPTDMAGPWKIDTATMRSTSFKLAVNQESHETVFIGGPCYLAWEKGMKGGWLAQWRPILYREVKVSVTNGGFEIIPEQGHWYLSPLVCSLIERLQISVGDDLDAFARDIIEASMARYNGDGSIGGAITDTLTGKLPDLEEAFHKESKKNTFDEEPSSWVLFAPTSTFSALTRYLMADYTRLEALLEEDPTNIGGLEVLDDSSDFEAEDVSDVLPVVLLNSAQQRAVEDILGNEPLSVISGPPGCGKSQVVVSVLLNAWATGKSVLFASNNNSAVDVVRKRLERFESEFPIAVRAGNREKNNVIELLRKTLNYANGCNETKDQQRTNEIKRRTLAKKRLELQERIDGKLPQRAAEGLRTALNAYGAYQKLLENVRKQEVEFEQEWENDGFKGLTLQAVKESVEESRNWLERIDYYKLEQKNDAILLTELEHKLLRERRKRNEIVGHVGLNAEDIDNWGWLVNGPSVSLLNAWEKDFLEILTGKQEEALEPFEWDNAFERWNSEKSAIITRDLAKEHSAFIRKQMAELLPRVARISQQRIDMGEKTTTLKKNGLEEKPEVSIKILTEWSSYYSEYISREQKKTDFLPWSQRSKLRRKLKKVEVLIRPYIPITKWREIGAVDSSGGRDKLAEAIEILRHWKQAVEQWSELEKERSEVEMSFEQMRAVSASLELPRIPEDENQDEWNCVVQDATELAKLADRASEGIRKKHAKEQTLSLISTVVRGWRSLASGQPLKESWSIGLGSKFTLALSRLQAEPTPIVLAEVRNAYYSGNLNELKRIWEQASQLQVEIDLVMRNIENIPKLEDRIKEWSLECPACCYFKFSQTHEWPSVEKHFSELDRISDLCVRFENFQQTEIPESQMQAKDEKKWADEQLLQAMNILPDSSARSELEGVYKTIIEDETVDWPIEKICENFNSFSPEIIKAEIAQIDAELEQGSFEDSKAAWLKRLNEDEDAIQAVDQLEKIMRRTNGRITEEHFDLFRRSLRVVPIWITTAQAAQAIPLEPKLFDLVVIDEASQCTVTNLLPLLYRGKRLAIIGDSDQLPAIPTIQESEELTLAKKFEIEPFLTIIGHASNDVYAMAADALPRGRAGVLNLNEHFRSNPQIIGFSNRHIYLQRLILKTDPSKGNSLPVGSGVHKQHVSGQVVRGDRGRSWKNLPEAHAVMELVRSLRSVKDMQNSSIGVVTPFSAQKECIRDMMQSEGLASKILVDSAYGFQGDERDIIIFSPVVAAGITTSASRWVESPPNLINVALTRARQALFVVGDFDYCLQQDSSGILHKLADYCNDVQTLRDTSPAELELFSWMIVEGWTPEIHPFIGDMEVDFSLVLQSGVRLVIEVDGSLHDHTKVTDNSRDAFLQAQGWKVMRIPARAVLETPHNVIENIKVALGI